MKTIIQWYKWIKVDTPFDQDLAPVAIFKLYAGNKEICWVLSELDPEMPAYDFDLCDLSEV